MRHHIKKNSVTKNYFHKLEFNTFLNENDFKTTYSKDNEQTQRTTRGK